jgi:hypothetical protein
MTAPATSHGGAYSLHRDGEPVGTIAAVIECHDMVDGKPIQNVTRDPDGSITYDGVKFTPVIRYTPSQYEQDARAAQGSYRIDGQDIVGNGNQEANA